MQPTLPLLLLLLCYFLGFPQGALLASMKPTYLQSTPAKVAPELHGLWLQKGYGRIWDIAEDHATLYHYTASFCYQDPHQSESPLAETYAFFATNPAKTSLTLYRFDYGDKTQEYPNSEQLVKIDALPAPCAATLAQPLDYSNHDGR